MIKKTPNKINLLTPTQTNYIFNYLKESGFKTIKFISINIKNFIVILTRVSTVTLLIKPQELSENNIKTIIFNISNVISNYLCSFIWGITGLILSIPILGILKVIFDNTKNFRPLYIILYFLLFLDFT